MKNKRLVIFLTTVVLLAVLGYILYLNFEIYPKKIPTPPLREVRTNNFAAMERWLEKTGRHFRIIKRASAHQIASAPEQTVLAFASFCSWNNAAELLVPWLEKGGNLILCLDEWFDESEEAALFLSGMGITIADP